MASLTITRLWLRVIWRTVPDTYDTLLDALLAAASEKLQAVSAGALAGTSGNGHSVQFSQLGVNSEDWAEAAELLMATYETASDVLIQSGIASPTDAQIYAEMLSRLQSSSSYRTDFTGLRQ